MKVTMGYIFNNIADIYDSLQDEISRNIFWARLHADMDLHNPAKTKMTGILKLTSLFVETNKGSIVWSDRLSHAIDNNKKIVIYGTRNIGRKVAALMLASQINFDCFCARKAERFPDGLMNKPVISPENLISEPENTFVIIAATNVYRAYDEIFDLLQRNHFPVEQIISYVDTFSIDYSKQYFEYPELFPKGKAFFDCGCYDGENSIAFAKWCGNDYSRIFAFEPDPKNYIKCKKELSNAGTRDVTLYACGLSDCSSTVNFLSDASGGSYVLQDASYRGVIAENELEKNADKLETVGTVSIDDVAGDAPVGFIKMDIEGYEMNALRGAKQVIIRDKPLLAICVYHKPGDVLEIMDYCKNLVPEYRFWLRQYDADYETVMYASTRALGK